MSKHFRYYFQGDALQAAPKHSDWWDRPNGFSVKAHLGELFASARALDKWFKKISMKEALPSLASFNMFFVPGHSAFLSLPCITKTSLWNANSHVSTCSAEGLEESDLYLKLKLLSCCQINSDRYILQQGTIAGSSCWSWPRLTWSRKLLPSITARSMEGCIIIKYHNCQSLNRNWYLAWEHPPLKKYSTTLFFSIEPITWSKSSLSDFLAAKTLNSFLPAFAPCLRSRMKLRQFLEWTRLAWNSHQSLQEAASPASPASPSCPTFAMSTSSQQKDPLKLGKQPNTPLKRRSWAALGLAPCNLHISLLSPHTAMKTNWGKHDSLWPCHNIQHQDKNIIRRSEKLSTVCSGVQQQFKISRNNKSHGKLLSPWVICCAFTWLCVHLRIRHGIHRAQTQDERVAK